MNIFKNSLLASAAIPSFIGLCSIEAEGGEAGGGGGSPPAESQAAGKASEGSELTTEQKLEKEFGQVPDSDDGSESSDGDGDEDEDGDEADDPKGEGDDDGGASGDDDEPGEGKGEAGTPPKKDPSQERIDELTARARDAERDRDKAYETLRAKGIDPSSADDLDLSVPEAPDPSKFEFGENDLDYIKAVAKHDARIEVLEDQAKARFTAEAANLDAKWTKNLVGAATRYPDFDEVVVQGGKDQKWACPPVIAVAVKDSDYGPDIAYQLAKDPDEAKRISKLSPLEQAREFGRIEERHHAKAERAKRKAEADGGKPKPRIVSRAPEPPKRHVRGGGGTHGVSADTDDFAAFDRLADKLIKSKTG